MWGKAIDPCLCNAFCYWLFCNEVEFYFQVIGVTLPYDKLEEIRSRLTEVSPNLTQYEKVEEANYFNQSQQLSNVS